MKPFLLLSTRPEDDLANQEYRAIQRFAGLDAAGLVQYRIDREPLGRLDRDAWSGVLLGGGPFTVSDPPVGRSAVQDRVEAELDALMADLLAAAVPFLGICYGIGVLGRHAGAVVDRRHGEPVGAIPVRLTAAGRADPLFGALPEAFDAFVGHKEAISDLPGHAIHLASTPACPVQAFRIGPNAYATQFHPELDVEGLCARIAAYQDHGYFAPEEAPVLQAAARAQVVDVPRLLLRRFVELFADRPVGEPPAPADLTGIEVTAALN